jgi:hypothetical protein
MPQTVYRWTITPNTLYGCFVPTQSQSNRVNLPHKGFDMKKKPLQGTPYTYQCGVGASSRAEDIIPVVKEHPEVPRTGDSRSGIVVYHGTMIVGAYITPGNISRSLRQIVVKEGYRGQGLATRMIEQWFREVPGVLDIKPQPINIGAVKAFLNAHENVVNWAVASGKSVPQEVIDAVSAHTEYDDILAKLPPVEATQPRAIYTRRRFG